MWSIQTITETYIQNNNTLYLCDSLSPLTSTGLHGSKSNWCENCQTNDKVSRTIDFRHLKAFTNIPDLWDRKRSKPGQNITFYITSGAKCVNVLHQWMCVCVYQMADTVESVVSHWKCQSKFAKSKKLGPIGHGVDQIKVLWVIFW